MAEKYSETRLLSPAFNEAVGWALDLHAHQLRKGTDIPYVSHLLAVTALVLEAGGTEDEAVAAVLHDAVEDCADVSVADVQARFGDAVATIVDGCTDAYGEPKPPWKERKLAYIEHLKHVPESGLLVSLADKTHNAKAILTDYREIGDELWDRFNAGKEGTLWYYTELANVIRSRAQGRVQRLANEFDGIVEAMVAESA